MEDLLNSFPLSADQLVAPLIAIMVAVFGFWIHERMRLQNYLSDLRQWAAACLDTLSEAVHLCDLEPSATQEPNFFNRRQAVLIALSAKIDQGRWFFPNAKPMDVDNWNVDNYIGLKQRPLDDLVYAYGAVKKMSYKEKQPNTLLRAPLVEIKKDFTLCILSLLDPRKAHKQFGLKMKMGDLRKNQ